MRRPLLIGGFMATGKTTVGRRVAELAGVAFEDLDAEIEARAGISVAEIFRRDGEAAFRRLERAELERVLAADGPRVVALGGGALVDRGLRLKALDRAVVVSLEAAPNVVLARSSAGPERPLLAVADPEARILELLELRRDVYAEAHARIDTETLTPDQAAEAALEIWKRDPIAVAAGSRSYVVDVGASLLEARLSAAVGEPTALLVVTDENVERIHGDRLARSLGTTRARIVLRPGETEKNVRALERIWQAALDAKLDRSSMILAFGGGVVSDIAGFAAATFMRGIRWMAVPTTLLAMVDASVGGKTAIDFHDAKNSIGAFWQPSAVLCDVSLLTTEPERGYASALAEVVKSALIGDPQLLDYLDARADAIAKRDASVLEPIVRQSVAVKARIVSADERESGLRAVLNLGHTIGHALEACTGYASYTHGEAVALGLVAALRIGGELGHTPPALVSRVISLLARFGLPTDLGQVPLESALELLGRDKKRHGTYIRFVVVHDVGKVDTIRLEPREITRLLGAALR